MVISQKHTLCDYTYREFKSIVEELIQAAGTREWQDRLLEHFFELVEHPAGSDLIYYPDSEAQGCAAQVMARIMAWRKSKGLPSFKDVK
ncbi:bacteriocin immunity protein [Pseudomonas sp. PSKL.D1]|uniref:bacteriocin immunity protein n=1 Tax=Pseudomonas sp. PSKL.D1 TaxID=3029060 RepID=UPI0023811A54|nr:bacteriocin immunity protein [Pseudomonas sp. PSKL.D1]WDY58870.1 bacteriocin immunity protein [Pseudomonas sp. PSKL.D1]